MTKRILLLLCVVIGDASAAITFDRTIIDTDTALLDVRDENIQLVSGNISHVHLNGESNLEMLDGDVGHIHFRDLSNATIRGGHISHVNAYDESYSEFFGGDQSHVRIYDASTAIIQGGIRSHLTGYHSASIDFLGGSSSFVTAEDNSVVTVSGDDTSIGVLRAYGGTVNLFGGNIENINPLPSGGDNVSVTNIYGGNVGDLTLNDGTITNAYVTKSELEFVEHVFDLTRHQWTGRFGDGTEFNAEVLLTSAAEFNVFIVPEPELQLFTIVFLALAIARREATSFADADTSRLRSGNRFEIQNLRSGPFTPVETPAKQEKSLGTTIDLSRRAKPESGDQRRNFERDLKTP